MPHTTTEGAIKSGGGCTEIPPPPPAEFLGKARRLITAITSEDARISAMLAAAWEPVRTQGRPRQSATDAFCRALERIQAALPLGAIAVRSSFQRGKAIVVISRARSSKMRLAIWNNPSAREQGLTVVNGGFVIGRLGGQATNAVRANVSIHAIARAYQRMSHASDADVVTAMLPLAMADLDKVCPDDRGEFNIGGWRGRFVRRGTKDEILAARTFGDWD